MPRSKCGRTVAKPVLQGFEMRSPACHNGGMAYSSTTYQAQWRSGKTKVLRVPETLAEEVLQYAHELDGSDCVRETQTVYRTAANVALYEPVNVASVPQRSPFRYPGGKTWLIPYIRTWLSSVKKRPSVLVEPFAGGGIVGLTAAFERLADHVVLVEKDSDVASVWRTILGGQADWLAHRIETFDLNEKTVRTILDSHPTSQRERAFATIVRNRVQRGGILAPGAGVVKSGENGKGLFSRWYPATLSKRIQAIASEKQHLSFIEGDGMEVLNAYSDDENAAFFVDPPYTFAAKRLYSHWQIDHRALFAALKKVKGPVLLTYDNTGEIESLAMEFGFDVQSIAMKNTHHARMTELLAGKDLTWLRNAQASHESRLQTAQGILEFPR